MLISLAAVFTLAGIAWGTYWALAGRFVEQTDDAYVSGDIVQITPQIAGTVLAVRASDTDFVRAGQTLVELDQADTRTALDQAEAQLAQAVRQVRALFAQEAQLEADVTQRLADLARDRADLERRVGLQSSGAIASEELAHARSQVRLAEAVLTAARQRLAAVRVQVDRTTVATHPDVERAAARLREAYLAWRRTVLPAPVSGFVARRNVQVGQTVQPGTPLMAVVPLDRVWVDANFKEGQLRRMRVGQPVTLTADAYGSAVTYHGTIAGLGAGTGAAFALLPAQNATGNWIKVVQRLPVRIALKPGELAAHPLRVGLSMQVAVNLRDGSDPRPKPVRSDSPADRTEAYAAETEGADALVQRIIAANGGGPSEAGSHSAAPRRFPTRYRDPAPDGIPP